MEAGGGASLVSAAKGVDRVRTLCIYEPIELLLLLLLLLMLLLLGLNWWCTIESLLVLYTICCRTWITWSVEAASMAINMLR